MLWCSYLVIVPCQRYSTGFEVRKKVLDSEFLKEINSLCETIATDFAQVKSELEGMIGDDKIVSYLLTKGSNPSFPNNLGEVFVLSEHCLYDYEIQKEGALCHVLFLSAISEITENHLSDEFMEFHFHTASGIDLMMVDKKDRKTQLREFCMKLKGNILAGKS